MSLQAVLCWLQFFPCFCRGLRKGKADEEDRYNFQEVLKYSRMWLLLMRLQLLFAWACFLVTFVSFLWGLFGTWERQSCDAACEVAV